MRFVLTAGFDKAAHVIAYAELLRRQGHDIHSILVVSPFTALRLRSFVRQRGVEGVLQAWRRMKGGDSSAHAHDPMSMLLRANEVSERSIRVWTRNHGVGYLTVKDLNSQDSIDWLHDADPDFVIYGGGGILRREFITAAKRRVLNAHSGPLPDVRGMNACEWSLLLGVPPAVTIHYIDEGIDTGACIQRREVEVGLGDTIDSLRGKCVITGVEAIVSLFPRSGAALPELSSRSEDSLSRQCFVLAPVLRELLERKLAERR